MEARAKGGVALIVTGGIAPNRRGLKKLYHQKAANINFYCALM